MQASTSFGRQLLGKLLAQGWRVSSGNVRLSHLLMSVLLLNICKITRITFLCNL